LAKIARIGNIPCQHSLGTPKFDLTGYTLKLSASKSRFDSY